MNRRIEKLIAVSIPAAILLLFMGLLYASSVPTPVISVDSGFYEEPFMVTVKVPPGCTVYYTIDGTEPDESSEKYISGILIYDRTPEDAYLANIEDISGQTLWVGGGNFYQPSHPIPKATVLTVRVLDRHGRWSDPIQNFYYVGEDYKKYQDITVVSLAVSPDDLFGENGIYINGEEYNSYVEQNGLSRLETDELNGIWELANWRKTGEEYRKDAFISILKDGQVYQSGAEINIAGHTSRIYPQKSFTIRLDKANDWVIIDDHFSTTGTAIQGLSSFKLRNGGTQNQNNFLNDYICQALSSELAFDTQAQQLCVLFLNGEYWGIYELTERYTEEYFYIHYGLKKQNHPALIKSGLYLDVGREDAKANYDSLVAWIMETDLTKEETYQELCDKIDVASLVQLYAVNTYLTNMDFVNNNIACWSYQDSENSQYVKWKWMMYDCDTIFNDVDTASMLEVFLNEDPLFEKLCQNDCFCHELANTIRNLQDTIFSPEQVNGFIDETINELMPFIEDHYDRIGPAENAALETSQKEDYFKRYGESIKTYLLQKSREDTSFIEAFLIENRYFTSETVQLSGEDWNAEHYIINGISSNEGTRTWTNDKEMHFKSLYFGEGYPNVKCRMKLSIQSTYGTQRINVIVNGQEVYCGSISGPGEICIPFLTGENGRADISLYLPDAVSPQELGEGSDKRKLALALQSITFEQNSPSPLKEYEYVPAEMILFYGKDWNADHFIANGIGMNEGTHTWFEGNEINFYSSNYGDGTSRTDCRMRLSIRDTLGEQRLIVLVNGEEIMCESVIGSSEMIIPFFTDENGSAQITFHLPDAISPKELGESDDSRVLSLDMASILIEEKRFN